MVIAMVVSIGLDAGIIFKSTAALWPFHDMDVFAFDKRGTLTEGKMRVLEVSLLDEQVSPLITALVASQNHPISKAISAHLGCAPNVLSRIRQGLSDPVVHPGKGLQSSFAGSALLGGSAEYAQAESEPDQKGDATSSVFYVTVGGLKVAQFALQDMQRPDAKELIQLLQAAGKRVVMISGDLPGPVERLAASIGLAPSDANSRCSPSGKLDIIRDLQISGRRICYVGDGANDAAALAAADIGIAIGGGADLAQATADITVASDRRLKDSIMSALALARLARWHIKVGLAWSIIYNVFAVLLASGAFVKVRIAPRWAGLGELASILPIFVIAFGTKMTWKMLSKSATGRIVEVRTDALESVAITLSRDS
jgi:cation transport ATPase